VFGRAGNDWGAGACPSIRFKALRMELNGILLQAGLGLLSKYFPATGSGKAFQISFFLDRE
jgi:hypothetical protein